MKKARVVELCKVVGYREFLDPLEEYRVLYRYRREVRERCQDEQVVFREALFALHLVYQFYHAQAPAARDERHADYRLRREVGYLIGLFREARVLVDVRHEKGLSLPGYPAGHAFADLEPQVLELLRALADRYLELELARAIVQKEQRPVLRPQELAYLVHYFFEDFVKVKRRGECLTKLRKNGELKPFLLEFPGLGRAEVLALAASDFHGATITHRALKIKDC